MYEDEDPPLCPLSEHFCGFPAFHACRLASPGIPVGESLQMCLRLIQVSLAGDATRIMFVANVFCRDKRMLAATNVLSRQFFKKKSVWFLQNAIN